MASVDVADVIERIGLKAMNQILSGKGISFSLPNRTGNHQYIPQLDANFLELKHMVRAFEDQSQVGKALHLLLLLHLFLLLLLLTRSQVKKVAIMARIAQCIHGT